MAIPASWLRKLLILALALFFAGCPKKITEEVVREVKGPCVPQAPPGPQVSVLDMVTVAIVKGPDGKNRAVLAAEGHAEIVPLHGEVGREKALVTAISEDGIVVRMPDQTGRKVPLRVPSSARATRKRPTAGDRRLRRLQQRSPPKRGRSSRSSSNGAPRSSRASWAATACRWTCCSRSPSP